jgi:hypothetical protein
MDSPGGEAAINGTAIHALSELRHRGHPIPPSIMVDDHVVNITDEMVEISDEYLRFIDLIKFDSDIFEVEDKLSLAWYYDPEPMRVLVDGTTDCWSYNSERQELTIIDLKTGVNPVYPDGPQNMLYALMAVGKLGGDMPKTIRLCIVQPRLPEKIKTCTITLAELMAFAKKVDDAINLIGRGDTTENPGAEQCKWCLRAGFCESRYDRSLTLAQASFDDGVPSPTGFSSDQLGAILDKAEEVEAWIRAVRGEVSRRIDNGEDVVGWKMVAKRAMRRWQDPEAARQALTSGDFEDLLVDEVFTPPELKSPAQIEKALKRIGVDAKVLEPLISRESSGNTLVRESDQRPKVLSSAASFFND